MSQPIIEIFSQLREISHANKPGKPKKLIIGLAIGAIILTIIGIIIGVYKKKENFKNKKKKEKIKKEKIKKDKIKKIAKKQKKQDIFSFF